MPHWNNFHVISQPIDFLHNNTIIQIHTFIYLFLEFTIYIYFLLFGMRLSTFHFFFFFFFDKKYFHWCRKKMYESGLIKYRMKIKMHLIHFIWDWITLKWKRYLTSYATCLGIWLKKEKKTISIFGNNENNLKVFFVTKNGWPASYFKTLTHILAFAIKSIHCNLLK